VNVRFLVLLGAMLLATLAHADGGRDLEAKRRYEEGTKAFNLGEFQRAVDEYRQAYNARPEPVFLYNIAQAYRLANNLPQALFFYKSYLHSDPSSPNRIEVEDRIRKLEQQVREQQVVTTQPPNTPVSPDARPRPSSDTAPSEPSARAPLPATSPSSNALTASAPAKAERKPLYKKWWLWTVVGVAAAGAGVGLGLGLSSSHAPSSHLGTSGVF
jgi:tetratricopeptide (TPR) repeat protein